MVQANADGRPRSRRARQSEEQAPLVESYLSSSGSTSYQGTCCLWDSQPGEGPVWWLHTLQELLADLVARGHLSWCTQDGWLPAQAGS